MIYHGTGYGNGGELDDLAFTIERATEIISDADISDQYDSIIVTGISGILVGSPVALLLNKPLVILRKDEDRHHNGCIAINEVRMGKRCLWLDDFIACGHTERRVWDFLDERYAKMAYCYLYREQRLLRVSDGLGINLYSDARHPRVSDWQIIDSGSVEQ